MAKLNREAPVRPRRAAWLALISLVWLFAVGWGARQLLSFAFTAGTTSGVADHWPAVSGVPRSGKPFDLVVALHPRCSCSRATIGVLKPILLEEDLVQTTVLLYRPAGAPLTWTETGLRTEAERLPGVRIVEDVGGKFASQFGASTSGEVLLYSGPTGRLLFAGGVTSARGHWGPSRGQDALSSILRHQANGIGSTPVFGCGLGQ